MAIPMKAQIAGLELKVSSLEDKVVEQQNYIRELQRALEQSSCNKVSKSFGIPREVRDRYFAANPTVKAASNQDILNWANQH